MMYRHEYFDVRARDVDERRANARIAQMVFDRAMLEQTLRDRHSLAERDSFK